MNSEQARALVTKVLEQPFDSTRFRQLIVELFNYAENIQSLEIPGGGGGGGYLQARLRMSRF